MDYAAPTIKVRRDRICFDKKPFFNDPAAITTQLERQEPALHETYVNLAKYIDLLGKRTWLPEKIAAIITPPPPPALLPLATPGQLEQLLEEEEPKDLGDPDLPQLIESPEEAGPAVLEVTLTPQEPMEVQQIPQQQDTHLEGSIEPLASAITEVVPALGLPAAQALDTETAEFNK